MALRKCLLFLPLFFIANPAHANKYWVATTTGNWNVSANWGATSGGAGGAGVPGVSDSVVFDGAKIGTCTINVNVSVSSITISTSGTGGYRNTVIALSTISITTTLDFALNNGTFTAQSSTMTINGDMILSGGIFANAASSVTVGGSWNNTGTSYRLNSTTSTVAFTSTGNEIIRSGSKNFSNVTFNNSGTWVLQDTMTITSTMTILHGTFDTSDTNCAGGSCNLSVGGTWGESGGAFLAKTSTVTFNAASAQRIAMNGDHFYNVLFNGTGPWVMQDSMTVISTVTLAGGTLNTSANNQPISVGGCWRNNAGIFTVNSSTVNFTSTSPGMTIRSRGFPFSTVDFGSGGGGYWTLVDSMTVSTMTISADNSLELAGFFLGVSSFTNAGNFILKGTEVMRSTTPFGMAGSTITYNATAGTPVVFSTWTYRNLVVNGTGITFKAAGALTIVEDLVLNAGTLDMTATNFPLTLDGDWNNNGGFFTARQSTVAFNGAVAQNVNNAGQAFGVIVDSNTSSGGVLFNSSFTATALRINGGILADGTTVYFDAGSTFTITGLTLTGFANNPVWMRSNAPSQPWYLHNSSTNTVSFVDVQDSSASTGVTIIGGPNSVDSGNNTNWTFLILSVSISTHIYNFGTINLAATTVSTVAVTVTNTGNATETYSLSVATTGAQTVWTVDVATPTAHDKFALFSLFNSVRPSSNTFNVPDVVLTTPTVSSVNVYSGDETGVTTPSASARHLWLRLDMPLTTSTTNQEQMNLTVTASSP